MKNSAPTVVIIIPTYNRAQLLPQALESVLNQSRPPDEVIVVDDGSTDTTADVLAHYKKRIRYLRKSNGGLPSALNHGLAATDADYVAVLDDDDLAIPDALERHLRFLASRPDIDFSYSGCYRFWSDTPPTPPYAGSLEIYDCADVDPDSLFLHALESYPFHTQGMLVPLRCYRAIGGFDESRLRAEDYDMILRLAQRFRGGKLKEPVFLLREHGGDRGPAHERHGIEERDAVFLHYGRQLFADLREKLTLAQYLPADSQTVPLDDLRTRRALLQRACVMARHGLFDEALEDLDAATATGFLDQPLTEEERRMCSRMMDIDPMLLEGGATFLRQAGALLTDRTPSLFYACVKGFGWSLSRELRNRRYRSSAAMAGKLVRILCGRGSLSFAGRICRHAAGL
ncbi:MAG TPA: glycosyltransferase family 2 protein [Gammaproteobacteria bacterium]|nr:glycosyltransferase family 2 protein [Gammaproteobacteria bacterium]